MSSINTNAGAMTALQTLKATNKAMDTTQSRIATGFRVNQASDNAAYWSLATTMRSDNKAMSTVQDALGLGAAQVDVAYTAMDVVKDTLDTIKTKLVAASQPGVDKGKIQEELNQLQNDLKTYAKSATFSGGNWLDVDSTGSQKIVASFVRDTSGGVSLQTIDVDTAKTALFTGDTKGMLQSGMSVDKDVTALAAPAGTPSNGTLGGTATITGLDTASLWAEGDTFSFEVAVNDGASVKVSMTRGAAAWDAAAFDTALADAGITGVTASLATGTLTLTGGTTLGNSVTISNLKGTEVDADVSVTSFNITDASADVLAANLQQVDTMLGKVTTAASDLGAIKSRIDSQSSFVGKIMDAVDRGVGQLVDADMTEESSRLQALQVQQQLGIQALSMANANSQSILSLFR